MIGIVGGVGTFAGIDLLRRIYRLTEARTDQDHLPVVLVSDPEKVVDRTRFLTGETNINPGLALADIIATLDRAGARIVGIPCNAAHAPSIYREILKRKPEKLLLVHLIEEVAEHLSTSYPGIRTAGILGTSGTYLSRVYSEPLSARGITALYPEQEIQDELIHPAVYDTSFGIKAYSDPVRPRAREALLQAARSLVDKGAEAIILGCTEIPLAIQEHEIGRAVVIDSMDVLARALIEKSKNL
jgi:aspartate racemase